MGLRVGRLVEIFADPLEGGDVSLYHDVSTAPLLGLRRRFRLVANLLSAMIRDGVSLARSVELAVQWGAILRAGPIPPVSDADFVLARTGGLGQCYQVVGIPQGCPLSMMFIVALYLPWYSYLGSQVGVQPQLYADNLKCVSREPEVLLSAARFTTGYVLLVGQEPAPCKCVLMSTSRVVRSNMRGWIVSDEGHQWSVKLDVRDLGVILIQLFMVGLLPWLPGFALLFLG